MKEYCVPKFICNDDVKKFRKELIVTQGELAVLLGVSTKTIARWEISDKEITGPITTVIQLYNNNKELIEGLEVPKQMYSLRMKYFFRNQLCTVIDIDERNKRIKTYNYHRELIYLAFGKIENPNYEDYESFVESRCIPRDRDKMKLALRELDIPFYDPLLIIEKTQGKMAEDEFSIEIVRDM